jgi:iron complex outermembrane receptor protein
LALPAFSQTQHETVQTSNVSGPQVAPAATPDQAAPPAPPPAPSERIVVTGSLFAGTPEDAAQPVDVFSTEDLEKQGAPSVVDLIKGLSAASGGSVGESNRFLGTAAGSATVNLRGFGAQRTLVLFNGRRMANLPMNPAQATVASVVDVNSIPTAATGRIEILKDGAAATYGSDAIGGVVNFITRTDLDGFEVSGEYTAIDGSDGDYTLDAAYGWQGDNGNILVTAGYRRRSELQTRDRDWAQRSRAENPFGGWSTASNPGTYTSIASAVDSNANGGYESFTAAGAFRDAGCEESGGSIASATSCAFQFTRFDNLVNDEYHYQLYSEANFDLSDTLRFHAEALWARHDVPEERVSPYQSTNQFPTPIDASGGSPGGGSSAIPATGLNTQSAFFVAANNPGLIALMTSGAGGACPYTTAICNGALANGVIASATGWRPGGNGGNELYRPDGADLQRRMSEGFRVAGGFNGEIDFLDGVTWDAGLTFMQNHGVAETPDRSVNRLQLAMRGYGSMDGAADQCDAADMTPGNAGNAAVGCYWFNPFTNSVATWASNGQPNTTVPNAGSAALSNDPRVVAWLQDMMILESYTRLFVADLVTTADTGVALPGGTIQVALGAQSRYDELSVDNADWNNTAGTPCVDSAPYGDGLPLCSGGIGAFTFYPAQPDESYDRWVHAAFTEMNFPILDNLDVTLAARYEAFGGNVGSTTNPKISAKYSPFDWLSFRASAGSTFRAPPQNTIQPGFARTQGQFTNPVSGVSLYRSIDTYNNPNLQPETADTYNVGVLFDFVELPFIGGDFRASVDYYNFAFKDELTTETAPAVYSTMFPGANPAAWGCNNATLLSRFRFAGGTGTTNTTPGTLSPDCHPNNFIGIAVNQINGPSVDTSGFDFSLTYDKAGVPWLFNGDLTLGLEGNHLVEYVRGALVTQDGFTIQAAQDRAGKYELLAQFWAYPMWRGNAFINYALGDHNIRWTTNYTAATEALTAGVAFSPEDNITHNLTYMVMLPMDFTVTATVNNIFDEDPPFYRSQYNYDYTQANPLGRTFKIALKKLF